MQSCCYIIGLPVLAMWRDKYYYPGHVVSKESSSMYAVSFDDGEMMIVEKDDIIVCDMLAIGQVSIVSVTNY